MPIFPLIRFVVLFVTLCNSFLFAQNVIASESEEQTIELSNKDEHEQPASFVDGQPVIRLEKKLQKISGLQTVELIAVNYQKEIPGFGVAVNINPLLELRSRYFAALAENSTAKAKYIQSQQNISRLRNLHSAEVISTKKLQQQKSQWLVDKARLDAAGFLINEIRNNVILNWGEKIAEWIIEPESPEFSRWINRQQTLLRITLPSDQNLTDIVKEIYIHRSGQRNLAVSANFISQAPYSGTISQGESYFYETDDPSIKSGMRFTAWIPHGRDTIRGVIIPESSVVRHLGQSYVYIQLNEELFARRSISKYMTTGKSYFVRHNISPGEKLVVTGAQVLLSEEFRGQIPDEDDDD